MKELKSEFEDWEKICKNDLIKRRFKCTETVLHIEICEKTEADYEEEKR